MLLPAYSIGEFYKEIIFCDQEQNERLKRKLQVAWGLEVMKPQ